MRVVLGFALLTVFPAHALDTLFVLDDSAHTITKLSDRGERLAALELPERADRIAISPDGTRLVALGRSDGFQSDRYGHVPSGESTIAIVDAQSMDLLQSHEGCWSLETGAVSGGVATGGQFAFSKDGQHLMLLCQGSWFKHQGGVITKRRRPFHPQAIAVELRTGNITARTTIDRPVSGWIRDPTNDSFVVLAPYQKKSSRTPERKAALLFLSPRAGSLDHELLVPANRRPVGLIAGGNLVYLFDRGVPKGKRKPRTSGKLRIIALAERRLADSIELGWNPRIQPSNIPGEVTIVSTAGRPSHVGSSRGLVQLVKAGRVMRQFDVPSRPQYVRSYPGDDRLYTIGLEHLTVTDLKSWNSESLPYGVSPLSVGTCW